MTDFENDESEVCDLAKQLESFSFDDISPLKKDEKLIKVVLKKATRRSDCILRSGALYKRSVEPIRRTREKRKPTTKMPTSTPSVSNQPQPQIPTLSALETVSKIVCRMVPIFSAENKQNINIELEIFIDCCKQVASVLRTTEEKAALASLVKTRLRGEAYDLVKYIKIEKVDDLLKLLKETFAKSKSINDVLEEIRYCRQSPRETVSDYGVRLNKLLVEGRRAIVDKYPQEIENEGLTQEMEEEAIQSFKTGVRSALIRQIVIGQMDKNLDDLIAIAEQVEKAEERQEKSRGCGINLLDMRRNPYDTQHDLTDIYQPERQQLNYQLPNVAQTHSFSNQFQISNSNHNQSYNRNANSFNRNNNNNNYMQNYGANNNRGNRQNFSSNNNNNRQNFSFNNNNNNRQNFSNNNNNNRRNFSSNNYNQNKDQCSFCGRLGHLYKDCRTRQQTLQCFKCKNFGHMAQNCNINNNTSHSYQNNQNRSQQTQRNVKCDWCARTTHTVNECRVKQNWERNHQTGNSGNA